MSAVLRSPPPELSSEAKRRRLEIQGGLSPSLSPIMPSPSSESEEPSHSTEVPVPTVDLPAGEEAKDHLKPSGESPELRLAVDSTSAPERSTVEDISKIETHQIGEPGTKNFAVRFTYDGMSISPWHDIPLYAGEDQKTVNFICEIPKNTAKKFEITRTVRGNPIMQDTTTTAGETKLREYQWPTVEQDPKGPRMKWNYGALPQTWEDPRHAEADISVDGVHPCGDNDPIDAIELGSEPMKVGEVAQVKVLGVLALVDSGETDWKLLVARTNDPKFENINTLTDLKESAFSTEIGDIRDWLENYKMPTKKRKNQFGFEGEAQNETYAMEKVRQTHEFWAKNTDNGQTNRELTN